MSSTQVKRSVCVIPGDDAAPEAVRPVLEVLRSMQLPLKFVELPSGEEGINRYGDSFEQVCRDAINECTTTLFGSTSGKTRVLSYLRWGKDTFANVRPVRYITGARSPLANPEGIDFVIVRENSEDLYIGIEGDVSSLHALQLKARNGAPLTEGHYALKVTSEAGTRRVARFAFELARQRLQQNGATKLTVATKYNMLPYTDGYFRDIVFDMANQYPDVPVEQYIVDDFARRIVADAHSLDVVLLPNLYGDILSDEAAGIVGGLGLAASGCYGEEFAYFEPVHGTAPDIAGTGRINPTATLLACVLMLDFLGLPEAAQQLETAIRAVYRDGRALTPDQGGSATAVEFCSALAKSL